MHGQSNFKINFKSEDNFPKSEMSWWKIYVLTITQAFWCVFHQHPTSKRAWNDHTGCNMVERIRNSIWWIQTLSSRHFFQEVLNIIKYTWQYHTGSRNVCWGFEKGRVKSIFQIHRRFTFFRYCTSSGWHPTQRRLEHKTYFGVKNIPDTLY